MQAATYLELHKDFKNGEKKREVLFISLKVAAVWVRRLNFINQQIHQNKLIDVFRQIDILSSFNTY